MSSFWIKLIAMACMVMDHVGFVFFPQYTWMRDIGRIAFPLFAFMIVEGFHYTSDKKKYLGRIAILAGVSEIPFDLALTSGIYDNEMMLQNTCFTLLLGLILLTIIEHIGTIKNRFRKILFNFLAVISAMFLAWWLRFDYGWQGILIIYVFELFRNNYIKKIIFTTIVMSTRGTWGLFGMFSFIPIWFYNGREGRKMKYLFYLFYPLHLIIIYLVRYRICHS